MPRSGRSRRARNRLWLAAPATLFVGAALLWPLLRLLAIARADGFVRLLADAYDRRALWGSLWLCALVAVVSTLLCFLPALALARGRFVGRSILRGAFAVPLALSGIVVGFIAIAMLGHAGALPVILHLDSLRGTAYSVSGLVAAYLYFELPRATLTLEAALTAIDGRVIDAARTLGASSWQVTRRVLLPLCAPALRAALGVTFAAALGSFGVALVLATRSPLLPVELYRALTGTLDDALAAAMALVLAAIALMVLSVTRGRR